MDVPEPNDREVREFAAGSPLSAMSDDENARPWAPPTDHSVDDTIEGNWAGRWNGGVDPTMSGDTEANWKDGRATVKVSSDRVYILFDWKGGARRGLIDASSRVRLRPAQIEETAGCLQSLKLAAVAVPATTHRTGCPMPRRLPSLSWNQAPRSPTPLLG
jgi:hypothetical protein